jgi:hypothetical protein
MRISVDVDEDTMKDVMKLTGEKGKGPALARAVEEFVKRKKAAHFGRLIRESAFDYPDYSTEEERALNPVTPLPKKA